MRVGSIGLGALTLPDLLASKAHASQSKADYVRDKAIVLLYMSGGASHIETFNPNMDAPSPYNSMTGEVNTSLSGVTFGVTFPTRMSPPRTSAPNRMMPEESSFARKS